MNADGFLPKYTLLKQGTYRILEAIGRGGFGRTYIAEHITLKRRVCIKEFFFKDACVRDESTLEVKVVLNDKKELVDKLRRKFLREARYLSEMQHPSIVRASDFFEENGTAYYVMDYIDGVSLDKALISQGALPETVVLKYIRQIADALRYVHRHGRLHLDVKPGNILVNQRGEAFLIDFGASKQYEMTDGESTMTSAATTKGYSPLEQMSSIIENFGPATDIYALGATMYKLLTNGELPEASEIANGKKPASLPATISHGTRSAVEAAMRVVKSERPQSIDEFIAILDGKNTYTEEVTEYGPVARVQETTHYYGNGNGGDSHPPYKRELVAPNKKKKKKGGFAAFAITLLIIGIVAVFILIVVRIANEGKTPYIEPSESVLKSDSEKVVTEEVVDSPIFVEPAEPEEDDEYTDEGYDESYITPAEEVVPEVDYEPEYIVSDSSTYYP